jgi:hypothetical protein
MYSVLSFMPDRNSQLKLSCWMARTVESLNQTSCWIKSYCCLWGL